MRTSSLQLVGCRKSTHAFTLNAAQGCLKSVIKRMVTNYAPVHFEREADHAHDFEDTVLEIGQGWPSGFPVTDSATQGQCYIL